ncbi:unnamed protein product [Rotaria socialis]|uniref:Transglutaminase-like domain-containing protein n=4 Tax=Rotaria socialis TaxID=392032 RepID=A0A820Y8I2_9BILA|nr:unnamed protein product [Rotaria socialis]CAF4544401.1 unnamed protein product [Rotaria socialis]
MGCKVCKGHTVNESAIQKTGNNNPSSKYQVGDSIITPTIEDNTISSNVRPVDDPIEVQLPEKDIHVHIQVADSQAFNNSFVQQRQQAINNRSYQTTVQSWQPKSLQQLAELIKAFSKGKSLVDRHWIIFYWIACNIDYDTESYFSKNYKDQTAEGVFRFKKGVCAGYANLYKYLCDQLGMPCEKVSGYAKGYGFEISNDAHTETDHAWNAVEIDHHWYLMESTWGAGHIGDRKQFKRELASYYFLPHPNEMIYHHLPEDPKWQLLKNSINMEQYLKLPKLHPLYFDLKLELVNPRDQAYVNLLPEKPYALVLIRAPATVKLIASLKSKNDEIDGGHRITFDEQKQWYNCYFAPSHVGNYKITIFAKGAATESNTYHEVLELSLDVKKILVNPISFPKTWDYFSDLGLQVISPQNTHVITLSNGISNTQILIRTPEDVELMGHLENEAKQAITGGHRVYYDQRKNVWRCDFAPDRDGLFEAIIMAKKKFQSGSYNAAVAFKIEATQIPLPPISYPYTWQHFYDFGLKIKAPAHRSNLIWAENASYAEVLIKAPDDVRLSGSIQYNRVAVENGSLAQFDNEKKLWQILFAPERTGRHEITVFASKTNEEGSSGVVRFDLDVTKLRRPMKFPMIYSTFQTAKCQLVTPIDGVLKKGAVVPIECVIPGAIDVNVRVDSKWIGSEGYRDPILQRQITVGSKEVGIYAKYEQKPGYDGLIKYTVE